MLQTSTSFSAFSLLTLLARPSSIGAVICALAMSIPSANAQEPTMQSQPTTIEVRDVGEIEAVEHTLMVPENRNNPESREIALRFVILPAVQPSDQSPVVYLAGGPGGSATGTARSRRWPLFDALRQDRDVILLDQRGTGRSDTPPVCTSSVGWTEADVANRDTFVQKQVAAFAECETIWRSKGVDLGGYTTQQSAADIAAVSEALGKKLSLLGISYGTHLALAAIKYHSEVLDRVALVSVEGLDQTVKLPARTDAYFARLENGLNASRVAAGLEPYPALAPALRTALARIERDRPVVDVFVARGRPPVKRTLGAFAVQSAIAFSLADPDRAHDVAEGILAMAADDPDYSFMAFRGFVMPERIRLRAMPTIMDIASGVSPDRMQMIEAQAKDALFGDATNFPMPHLASAGAAYVLPPEFREGPEGDTTILVVSGTLDGRTYPESAIEATQGLANRSVLTVENGGHNLFFDHPEVVPSILAFLRGQPLEYNRIVAPLPEVPAR